MPIVDDRMTCARLATMADTWDMLRLALTAFHAAVDRVATVPAASELSMYAPLTEAAWWAISVDEGLKQRAGYQSTRNSSPTGQTVAGLYYARGALGHHRAFIAPPSAGVQVPPTFPFTVTVVPRWLPLLSLPDMGTQGAWARQFYTDRLARRSVLETLQEAGEWLSSAMPQLR